MLVDCLMQVYRIGFLVTSLPVNCNCPQVTIHRRTECITSKAEDLSFALLAVIPFLFSLLGFMKDLCDRIRISCTQTIQCVYLVDTISAAGLYVCPDQCIIICGLH